MTRFNYSIQPTDSLYAQVERVVLAIEYQLGILDEEFFSKMQKTTPAKVWTAMTPDVMYELPKQYWCDRMVEIYAIKCTLNTQKDMLETILEQNKPSLLESDSHPD